MNPSIHTAQVLPARAVLFLGIVALHGLFAYLFATGLISTTIRVLAPDMEFIKLPPERPPPKPTPPTPPVTLTAFEAPLPVIPPISLPPSETSITLPSESLSMPPPIVDGPPPAPLPIRLVGRNVMPNTADYYPPSEIRQLNEGTAEVQSCVDTNGRLDGTPTVEETSGHGPLDKAAIRLARDGKYARAFRGEVAVPNCYRFRVTFTLH